jgi:AraC-like DNA-binding protein
LLDQAVSRRIEVDGVAPEDYTTVLAPLGPGDFHINGQSLNSGGLCLLESGAELHTVNNQILRVMGINVPNSLLENTGRANLETRQSHRRDQMMLIGRDTQLVAQFRSLIHGTLCRPIDRHFAAERASVIASSLAAIIDRCNGSPDRAPGISRAEVWRIIRRARSYIEAHLDESIRMSAICMYCATSLSKLERIFRRELQMSPSQYVLARRLVAVNRELADFQTNIPRISDVAMRYGFNHLGRFSGAYHRHFGELPSQTLRLA